MSTYDYINDFWDRLPVRWNDAANKPLPIEDGAGRTDAQLDAWEQQVGGFKLPKLLREQFKVQNGGYPKREAYKDESGQTLAYDYEDSMIDIFINDSHLNPIGGKYLTFRQWLHYIWDDEEIAENLPGWDLDKVVILSFMYGHSLLFLDYGYLPGTSYDEPQVIRMETDDFTEEMRVPNWEQFVAGLVMYDDDEE